jgi:hypothetical protein
VEDATLEQLDGVYDLSADLPVQTNGRSGDSVSRFVFNRFWTVFTSALWLRPRRPTD